MSIFDRIFYLTNPVWSDFVIALKRKVYFCFNK